MLKPMLKQWILNTLFAYALAGSSIAALANNLPDFTELAERHGQEVVNISVTQTLHGGGGQTAMPFPGMPDDEDIPEFFKRFGIPGTPGIPGQGNPNGGQDYRRLPCRARRSCAPRPQNPRGRG